MFRLLKAIFTIFLFIQNYLAYADGDWSSGGGTLPTNKDNPWFIDASTTEVNYCINIDEDNFGITKEEAKKIVDRAINYWKINFETQEYDDSIIGMVSLYSMANLHFVYQNECNSEIDLRFQLGFLEENDKKIVGNLPGVVASAIRTSYDRKQLKGKGFIYVVPEKGENAPSEKFKFVDNFWSSDFSGNRLYIVLVHELGHVFGIGHDSTIPFMYKYYPYNIISESYDELIQGPISDIVLPHYLNGSKVWKNNTYFLTTNINEESSQFFTIPFPAYLPKRTFYIRNILDDLSKVFVTENKTGTHEVTTEIGEIFWTDKCVMGLITSDLTISEILILDEEQEVFKDLPDNIVYPLRGFTRCQTDGIFIPKDPQMKSKVVTRTANAENVILSGKEILNNKINSMELIFNFQNKLLK